MAAVHIFTSARVSENDFDDLATHAPTAHFRCCTQDGVPDMDHSLSARGGIGQNGQFLLPRWKHKSVLTFSINKDSFPKHADIKGLKAALDAAAKDWNDKDIGVRFERVKGKPALFGVEYKGAMPNMKDKNGQGYVTYATSFFPNSPCRVVDVFDPALQVAAPDPPDFLADIFRHEFGHILGLRHDDAGLTEPYNDSVELEPSKETEPSIMKSVFALERNLDIRPSEIKALKKLYLELGDGDKVDHFTVVTVDPGHLPSYQPAMHESPHVHFSGQASLVGTETNLVAHGHTTTIALVAISACVVLGFVMMPRITVTCSSHMPGHDGEQWETGMAAPMFLARFE